MGGSGNFVPFRRHSFGFQGLIQQIRLARGYHFVRCPVHQQHGRTVFPDIGNGVGCFRGFGIGADPAVFPAEYRAAVDPQGFCGTGRLMEFLVFRAVVHAHPAQVRQTVEIHGTVHLAGLLEVLSLVKGSCTASGPCKSGQIAPSTAPYDADPGFVDVPLVRMGPEIPDGSLHVFQRFREPGGRSHPISDAGHHIAFFRQIVPQLDPVIPVGVDETASGHIDDGGHFFFFLGLEQIHGHGHIGIAPGGHLFIDHAGNLLHFRFHRSHLQCLTGVMPRRLRSGNSRHAQQQQAGQHQPPQSSLDFHRFFSPF